MDRTSYSRYLMDLAIVASRRGTCAKRQVGAVVAGVDKHILAITYNGAPSGQDHCIDRPCKALTLAAPASHLACRAIHAEANALLLAGKAAKGGTLACTTTPCYECAKLIVASGIKNLITGEVNRLFQDTTNYSESPASLLAASGVTLTIVEA